MLDETLEDTACNSDRVSLSSLASTPMECSNKPDWITSTSDSSMELVPIPVDIPSNKDETLEKSLSVDRESIEAPTVSDPDAKLSAGEFLDFFLVIVK